MDVLEQSSDLSWHEFTILRIRSGQTSQISFQFPNSRSGSGQAMSSIHMDSRRILYFGSCTQKRTRLSVVISLGTRARAMDAGCISAPQVMGQHVTSAKFCGRRFTTRKRQHRQLHVLAFYGYVTKRQGATWRMHMPSRVQKKRQ